MKLSHAALALISIALAYLLILVWVDSRSQVFAHAPQVAAQLPGILACSCGAYLLRYIRWKWLLHRAGSPVSGFRAVLAYLSGFAFTASPGKVGELIRVRYFSLMGIPSEKVVAAFVFERLLDLFATLLIASVVASRIARFDVIIGFVLTIAAIALLIAARPQFLLRTAAWLRQKRWSKTGKLVRTLGLGISGIRVWATPIDLALGFALGLGAWTLTAASLAWMVSSGPADIPTILATSIYAAAMLAGAASMIPGGLGSTEAAIVAMLMSAGLPLGTATLSAVAVRLGTLWFAILIGMLSVAILESRYHEEPGTSGSHAP